MVYKFRSVFDRSKEYTIETNEPLELYNDFSVSIKKVDNEKKTYSYDNIDCVLKYFKRGTLGIKTIELDRDNFSGFYMMVETFKERNCLTMGEALELVTEHNQEEITIDNADTETRMAFEHYLKNSGIINTLFKCFLNGVQYGNTKNKPRRI